MFSSGADEPLTFSLLEDTSGLPTLFSKGVAVTYDVEGGVLTASAGARTVFVLTVNPDGTWTFDLQDQLDHVDTGANDENFGLRTSADGSTSVLGIDFSSIIGATDSDGDSVSGLNQGSFSIQVQDDVPVVLGKSVQAYTSTDEPIRIPGAGTFGPPVSSIINVPDGGSIQDLNVILNLTHTFMSDLVVTLTSPGGTTITLFSNVGGGDDPTGGDIVLDDEASQNIGSAPAPFTGTWQPESDLLSAFDGENPAGNWTLTISDAVGGDSGFLVNWDLVVTTGSGSGPVTQTVAVDEDDLTGPLSVGNDDVQDGDDLPVGGSPSVSGALALSVGADEPADVTFVAMHGLTVTGTFSDNSIGPVESQGRPLYYFWDGTTHTLYATWVAPADFGTGNPANNAAFSVVVTPATGAYTLTLLDQLDHLPNSEEVEQEQPESLVALDISEFALVGGTAFEDNIRLNLTYTVTDFDGDEANGTVNFDIDDDVPVQVGEAVVLGQVDEDELPDGITDGDGVTTVATGNLSSLVSVGADEDGTFTIGQTGLLPQNLTSQGAPVVYNVNGDTLTGFVDTGPVGLDVDDRLVFTLQVNPNGAFTFTLLDQLDHLPNVPANDDDQTLTIDFSSAIQFTDFDLDTITLQGGFSIAIEDDVPNAIVLEIAADTLVLDESAVGTETDGDSDPRVLRPSRRTLLTTLLRQGFTEQTAPAPRPMR